MFISKTGRAEHGSVKDFRPISLSSFILKLLESLVDRYIKEVALVASPLCPGQHAYQNGKSTGTALAELVTEKRMTNGLCSGSSAGD